MTQEILDVRPFLQPRTPIEFLMLPLQGLFNHQQYPMDTPQRLHSYVMVLFTKGTGQHYVDFAAYPYQEGTLLFIAENQVHQWEINLQNDAFVLTFSKEFLYKSSEDRDLLENYRIFDYALQSPTILLENEDYQRFLRLFSELWYEFNQQKTDAFQQDIYRNLLRTMLLLAERLKHSQVPYPVLTHYRDFTRFREQVETDYPCTRNVQDYAVTLGYSPKKLNQLTKTILNKSAKDFVDERVILEIKRLLIHTNLSIKEIAEYTGFDEPTNLVKFFKRYAHLTPTDFRALLAQSGS